MHAGRHAGRRASRTVQYVLAAFFLLQQAAGLYSTDCAVFVVVNGYELSEFPSFLFELSFLLFLGSFFPPLVVVELCLCVCVCVCVNFFFPPRLRFTMETSLGRMCSSSAGGKLPLL
jgi:hypothetical protein